MVHFCDVNDKPVRRGRTGRDKCSWWICHLGLREGSKFRFEADWRRFLPHFLSFPRNTFRGDPGMPAGRHSKCLQQKKYNQKRYHNFTLNNSILDPRSSIVLSKKQ